MKEEQTEINLNFVFFLESVHASFLNTGAVFLAVHISCPIPVTDPCEFGHNSVHVKTYSSDHLPQYIDAY